jgi:hypothetical protein
MIKDYDFHQNYSTGAMNLTSMERQNHGALKDDSSMVTDFVPKLITAYTICHSMLYMSQYAPYVAAWKP